MTDVVVYTKDGPESSSAYYRLLQYRPHVDGLGSARIRVLVPERLRRARYNLEGAIASPKFGLFVRIAYVAVAHTRACAFLALDIARGADVVVIIRSLIPGKFLAPTSWLYRGLLNRTSRVIWDFDDDILRNGEITAAEHEMLQSIAQTIVTTHASLASTLDATSKSKTFTLPTTDGDLRNLDLERANDGRQATFRRELRVVWVASSAGLVDLRSIVEALDEAGRLVHEATGKTFTLEVVCNQPLDHDFKVVNLVNTRWSRSAAKTALLRSHVGLMPLLNTAFNQEKGGFKLVQYLSAGLPVVASAVGFNKHIVAHNGCGLLIEPSGDQPDWATALASMALDERQWLRMSSRARNRWSTSFSFDEAANFWFRTLEGDMRLLTVE